MGGAEIGLLMLSHYYKCYFLNVFLLNFSRKKHSNNMIV
jgi:hypothetical protein